MEEVDFTDDEIYQELEGLGYRNIPPERFQQFKRELFHLIRQERSHNNSSSSSRTDVSSSFIDRPHVEFRDTAVAARTRSVEDVHDPSCDVPSVQLHLPDKENVVVNPRQVGHVHGSVSARELSSHGGGMDSNPFTARVSKHAPQHVMKRKVLRKVDGQVSICESITDSEASDDLAGLQEQLRNTVLDSRRPQSAPPVSESYHSHRPHTACRQPSLYNLPQDYQGPKALIRPMSCEPHTQNIKKTDPVARYRTYQRCWTACRAPGEKAHKQLRWGVREKMLYHDEVVEKKPQRSYQPNGYVIPSDKKRKTLRWQIRMDLAQGVKPPSAFD